MLLYPSFAIQMYSAPLHPYRACPGLLCIVTDAICDLCRSYLTRTLISQLLQVWLVATHTCLLDLEMQSGATSISGTIGVISF